MSIQAIDSTSVHRLTSGQVVTSLPTALKELVDNALDARAGSVEVRLKEHGLDSIEVVDDGSGIPRADYASIALKHHTSKLASFADLTSVRTLGFRGEALSSLCALCGSVEVVTATADEAPVGTRIRFDKGGRVASDGEKVARTRGTTITLTGLFAPTPVRLAALQKNAKREFAKAVTLLQGYALVAHLDGTTGEVRPKGKGVRWSVVSTGAKGGKKTVHLKTDGSGNLKATLSSLWGPRGAEGLVEIDFEIELPGDRAGDEAADGHSRRICRVHGLISSPTQPARSSADRQFYSINARPFTPTKIQKAVNDAWRSLNPSHTPVVVLNLFIPPDTFDVNVSPDKRTVFFHDENFLLEAIRSNLLAKFGGSSAGGIIRAFQPAAQAGGSSVPDRLQALKQTKLGAGFRPAVEEIDLDEEEAEEDEVRPPARGRELSSDKLFSSPPGSPADAASTTRTAQTPSWAAPAASSPPRPASAAFRSPEEDDGEDDDLGRQPSASGSGSRSPSSRPSPPRRPLSLVAEGKQRERSAPVAVLKVDLQSLMRGRRATPVTRQASAPVDDEEEGEGELDDDDDVQEDPMSRSHKRPISPVQDPSDDENDTEIATGRRQEPISQHPAPASQPPAPRPRKTRTIRCDQAKILARVRASIPRPPTSAPPTAPAADVQISSERASITAPAEVAERELSRTIVKADFATMEPLGQFNMGFIIARKRALGPAGAGGDDLFIIDQHASDEKFNFEALQNETRILSQGLLQPRVLELSAVDVELVQDNMEVLKKNGFEVGFEETPGADDDEAGQMVVTLRAQPVSKETVFDFSDLEELLHLMKDQPSGQMVRCSKARAMFAMRACRKSVMVGRPLTKPQMTKVVRNMGLIDHPWNCPHGRPTMRHLTNLTDIVRRRGRHQRRAVDWAAALDDDDDEGEGGDAFVAGS